MLVQVGLEYDESIDPITGFVSKIRLSDILDDNWCLGDKENEIDTSYFSDMGSLEEYCIIFLPPFSKEDTQERRLPLFWIPTRQASRKH